MRERFLRSFGTYGATRVGHEIMNQTLCDSFSKSSFLCVSFFLSFTCGTLRILNVRARTLSTLHQVGACIDRHVQGSRVSQPAAVRGPHGAHQPSQSGQREEPYRGRKGDFVLPVLAGTAICVSRSSGWHGFGLALKPAPAVLLYVRHALTHTILEQSCGALAWLTASKA